MKISRLRKHLAFLLMVMIIQLGAFAQYPAGAADSQVYVLHNDRIARGIFLQAHDYNNYQGIAGRRQREYILTAELNDPSVQVMTAKAGDKVLKLETVSKQIAQELAKGHNITAGINGDMFNISQGTPHYGAPLGLQIKDGKIMVGFETKGSGPRYPVFAIDVNRKPMIGYLSMDNWLTVIKEGEAADSGDQSDLTIEIDTINRNNQVMSDQMTLLTPQLADQPSISFTADAAGAANLTLLKETSGTYDGSIKLGQEYEAQVVAITSVSAADQSVSIPGDSMLLASQGAKADWVRQNLRVGDKVRFSFSLKDQNGSRLDLDQAVTAWLPLVEDGQALTKSEMLEICQNDWDKGMAVINAEDKARTAIGFTQDNQVVALVIDGGGASGDSHGVDLPTMAARMEELGAVAAVSLDGGGSTQMNARLFGESQVTLISSPSDRGKERPVSNTILFASTAPRSGDVAELKINNDVTIFKNTSYSFQVRGQDSNGHPVDLSQAEIAWDLENLQKEAFPKDAAIDQNGLFQAGNQPGRVRIKAGLGEVQATALVEVVESVPSLKISNSEIIAVYPGTPQQLALAAYTQEGQPIIINNQAAQWSVNPPSLAAIDQQGLLTPLRKGSGVVKARVGDQETVLHIVSGLESQLIEDFEAYQTDSYQVDGYIGGSCSLSADQVKSGQYALQVDYDYANWGRVYNGTINVRLNDDLKGSGYTSQVSPKRLGMWVHGDGKAPWLRAVIKDGHGHNHIIDLAPRIDWVGWRYVSAQLPDGISGPVTLDYFYMVETDKSKDWRGTVYFDDIQFLYIDSDHQVIELN
jgi:hypothetical protein